MKNLSLALFFSIFSFTLSAQVAESSAIDALFSKWDKKDSPGCALGIVRDGALIYTKGYGMADLEHDIPITPVFATRQK